jgi:multiple sugar transport system ATP-binding protein
VDAGEFKLPINSSAKGLVKDGQKVTLGIRPEAIVDAALPGPVSKGAHNSVPMKVDVLEPLGHEYTAYLNIGKHNLIATLDPSTKVKENAQSEFLINLDEIHVFDAESEEAIR